MLRVVRKLMALGILVAAAGVGCAYGEVRHVVRAQFASDTDCGDVHVERKGLAYAPDEGDQDRYKVTGCGVERTYTCPRDAGLVEYGDEKVCRWVLGDSDRPQAAQAPAGVEDPFADDASDAAPATEPADAEPSEDKPRKGKKKP